MLRKYARQLTALVAVLAATLALSSAAFADDHIKGVIIEHGNSGTITVQTADSTVVVMLTDSTKVRRDDGLSEAVMSSATLIPGLRVEVSGETLTGNRFS